MYFGMKGATDLWGSMVLGSKPAEEMSKKDLNYKNLIEVQKDDNIYDLNINFGKESVKKDSNFFVIRKIDRRHRCGICLPPSFRLIT